MIWLLLIPTIIIAFAWWAAWMAAVDRASWRFRAGYTNPATRDRQVRGRWMAGNAGAVLIVAVGILIVVTS